jgi:hypothetical protein
MAPGLAEWRFCHKVWHRGAGRPEGLRALKAASCLAWPHGAAAIGLTVVTMPDASRGAPGQPGPAARLSSSVVLP